MSAIQADVFDAPLPGYGLPHGSFAAGSELTMLVHHAGDIVPSSSGRSGSATYTGGIAASEPTCVVASA